MAKKMVEFNHEKVFGRHKVKIKQDRGAMYKIDRCLGKKSVSINLLLISATINFSVQAFFGIS